jgi:hypothetical protein
MVVRTEDLQIHQSGLIQKPSCSIRSSSKRSAKQFGSSRHLICKFRVLLTAFIKFGYARRFLAVAKKIQLVLSGAV